MDDKRYIQPGPTHRSFHVAARNLWPGLRDAEAPAREPALGLTETPKRGGCSARRQPVCLGPALALMAAVATGFNWSMVIWQAGAPWVAPEFQGIALTASGIGLAALAGFGGLTVAQQTSRPVSNGTKIAATAGAILLACLALSVVVARAPLLSLDRTVEVGLGFLAYLTVARRPELARWILVGFAIVVAIQAPLVALQEITQSTFPDGRFLYGWGQDFPASLPGAAVVVGEHGVRWQRAMGSFSHPNVTGGFLAVFLVLALPCLSRVSRAGEPGDSVSKSASLTVADAPSRLWLAVWTAGWVELMFTFSRAALLAALIGCGAWAISQARFPRARRALARLAVPPAIALVVVAFTAGPILFERIEPTTAQLSTVPVEGRLMLLGVALQVIRQHPLLGVGVGNLAIIQALPPFNGIAVDPVHVVPLLVAAEAGIPAGIAWLAVILGPPLGERSEGGRLDLALCGRLAAPLALLVLGSLDHYLWTLAPGRSIFWLALAAWGRLK